MKLITSKVEQWFIDRNLQSLNGAGQIVKLTEEVRELEDDMEDEGWKLKRQ